MMFSDNNGNPSAISRELLEIVKKSLPKRVIEEVSEVEPNHLYNAPSPTKAAKRRESHRDYKTILLLFPQRLLSSKITEIRVGIVKRTSGPNTGYLMLDVILEGRRHFENPLTIEFWDEEHAPEMLKFMFDKVLTLK